MSSVTLHFRTTGLDKKLRAGISGPVRADLRERAGRVRDQAKFNLRARSKNPTGKIERSIRFATRATEDGGGVAQVGSDLDEALWVERGTGVYGPHNRPIVPTVRKRLRFNIGQRTLYLVSVEGQKGKHYLRDAVDAAV